MGKYDDKPFDEKAFLNLLDLIAKGGKKFADSLRKTKYEPDLNAKAYTGKSGEELFREWFKSIQEDHIRYDQQNLPIGEQAEYLARSIIRMEEDPTIFEFRDKVDEEKEEDKIDLTDIKSLIGFLFPDDNLKQEVERSYDSLREQKQTLEKTLGEMIEVYKRMEPKGKEGLKKLQELRQKIEDISAGGRLDRTFSEAAFDEFRLKLNESYQAWKLAAEKKGATPRQTTEQEFFNSLMDPSNKNTYAQFLLVGLQELEKAINAKDKKPEFAPMDLLNLDKKGNLFSKAHKSFMTFIDQVSAYRSGEAPKVEKSNRSRLQNMFLTAKAKAVQSFYGWKSDEAKNQAALDRQIKRVEEEKRLIQARKMMGETSAKRRVEGGHNPPRPEGYVATNQNNQAPTANTGWKPGIINQTEAQGKQEQGIEDNNEKPVHSTYRR